MKEKIDLLNKAAKAYYQEDRELISNLEYDSLYDELVELERETGIVLAGSPTVRVGYEAVTSLPKERHERSMLSLDKTKDAEVLRSWLGDQKGLLSWKLDGLTVVLTYDEGALIKAVTRGNGEVGEVVTNNAKVFVNIPLTIPFKKRVILRGEAVIGYRDFNELNSRLTEVEAKYKNPRNLCSGSVRQLNNKITAERNINFFAFGVVHNEGIDFSNSRENQLEWVSDQGFDIVPYKVVTSKNLNKCVKWFSENVQKYDLPTDGLVLTYDDISFGMSLGYTSKFPKDSIAFKWMDEIKSTKLLNIEWSASRTGQINPIAIFQPVELEGTTVSRASVHNISIMEGLKLGTGDEIRVYKANMIIPQIAENLTGSNTIEVPNACPVKPTLIKQESDAKVLFCSNEDCPAKHVKAYTHFVSRDAMGIDGFSEATVEKFIAKGFIKEQADIFKIERHRDEIIVMEGFGEKSYSNLIESVNKARVTNPVRLLYSLGIPNIGLANAKTICKHFNYDWLKIQAATYDEMVGIYGIGNVMAEDFVRYFKDKENLRKISDILEEIEFEKVQSNTGEQPFGNLTFVITGSLVHYENRAALREIIENNGGKVTNAVTSKTSYLINNDVTSNSSKSNRAKELGIPIINEETFNQWLTEGIRP
ncbi:MAG TPA: NAD-dependent DNA ligase LigA [Anaerovoracaceae bacterium]|nr:NAD-dependent DNA ligase LigA [Anaerovoracaceae bacterium]